MNEDKLEALKKIQVILMDLDGCLTTGHIIYSTSGEDIKMFHTHDGFGITRGRELGLKFAVISGMGSPVNHRRVEKLGIHHLYEYIKDKTIPFEELKKEYNLPAEAFAFIGDDEFDIPLLQKVGFSACPSSAIDEVKNHVDYVCKRAGGDGSIRELIDMVLKAKGLL
ncbi:MAG TPA: hypothetical protein DEP28_02360 [Bacteroidetes bacterium]|nr:hypothetical protein [Bacteroidota bacterium]HCN38105.1 hypothetical protein [Bacteroidota bacterium]